MTSGAWSLPDPWTMLGLARTEDTRAIRKAYAARLRSIDPEEDPAAFIALRESLDAALGEARAGEPSAAVQTEDGKSATGAYAEQEEPAAHAAPPAATADLAAINLLHAMVFDPQDQHTPEEITAQTERVLAEPAMLNIDHASAVEAFMAETIVRGIPRSDAILDPAIAHFRWSSPQTELERPPIVEWILRRRGDSYFESSLPLQSLFYAKLLWSLRQPPPTRWVRLTAWWRGVHMEYLLAYLETMHPTVLSGVDQATLEWWYHQIESQRRALPPLRWVREGWRRLVWARGLETDTREPSLPLYWAIFVFPYVFAWLLLRRGHSWKERSIGFGYLAVIALLAVLVPTGAGGDQPEMQSAPAIPSPVALEAFQDFSTDAQRFIDLATGSRVPLAELQSKNPALYAALEDEWKASLQNQDLDAFHSAVGELLDDVFQASLKGGDAKFVRDHAAYYGSRLRWAARGSMEDCDDLIRGEFTGPEVASLRTYRGRLLARAMMQTPPPSVPPDQPNGRFSIPDAIFDDARRLSRLEQSDFAEAMRGEGTAAHRCVARIALIDTAGARPGDEATRLLRNMFGGG